MNRSPALFERLLQTGKGVRRKLPGGGRLRIDGPTPALVVHRIRPDAPDPTLVDLFSPSVSFLAGPADADTEELVAAALAVLGDAFGAFVLVEVWPGDPAGALGLFAPADPAAVPLINELQGALCGLTVGGRALALETLRDVPRRSGRAEEA